MKITLGKCWQTTQGALVFQSSVFDGEARKKGFIVIDAEHPNLPVYFTSQKPENVIAAGSIAMLVRKHLATATLTGVAIHSQAEYQQTASKEYLRLRLQGRSASGDPTEIMVMVSHKPTREINIIKPPLSLARLQAKAQYTMLKPLPEHVLAETEEIPEAGFHAWLQYIFTGYEDSTTVATNQYTGSSHSASTAIDESRPPVSTIHRTARDRVARRIKTLKKTLLQDQAKIPSLEQLQLARDQANLLRDYLWLVKPNDFQLHLDPAQTGTTSITIDLNPDLTPGANLEQLFQRVKKFEKSLAIAAPRAESLKRQIATFEEALGLLRAPNSQPTDREILALLQTLGLERSTLSTDTRNNSKSRQKSSPKSPIGRTFAATSGALILMGRNAEESDLVVKVARSQDWWLHIAGGGHGSHIIVTGAQVKDSLPALDLRDAGILALHFSDRSQATEGEVYVARRQQIKKRKGMAPGLWQIDRAKTVVLRYSAEELAAIFAREIRDGQQRRQ